MSTTSLTGFSIYSEQTFNGVHNNTIYNASGFIQIEEGKINGEYTSLPLSSPNATWTNIEANHTLKENTTIKFQLANCSSQDCTNFLGPDGTTSTYFTTSSSFNLEGEYFAYKAYLSSDNPATSPTLSQVDITYKKQNLVPPTLNVSSPTEGSKYHESDSIQLSLQASDSDNNLESCYYQINSGATTVIPNCTNLALSLSDGEKELAVYANDSEGLTAKVEINFKVYPDSESFDSPSEEESDNSEEEEESTNEGSGSSTGSETPSQSQPTTEVNTSSEVPTEQITETPEAAEVIKEEPKFSMSQIDLSVEKNNILITNCVLEDSSNLAQEIRIEYQLSENGVIITNGTTTFNLQPTSTRDCNLEIVLPEEYPEIAVLEITAANSNMNVKIERALQLKTPINANKGISGLAIFENANVSTPLVIGIIAAIIALSITARIIYKRRSQANSKA